ncbi:MAG: protein tyrosine phosphatase [Gemmatimonadetes bacterium]|nr:protein tyrosine phosphatase [Gemmatimonadota bacterium]
MTFVTQPLESEPLVHDGTPTVTLWRRATVLTRSVYRRIREICQGILHPRRRRSARARLLRAAPVESVLFICHGNICRSSYAEFAFRRQASGVALVVESAGFVGPDRQPPSVALQVALRRGLDMSAHRSRLLTQPMLDKAGIIVVMSAEQAAVVRISVRRDVVIVLGDLDPQPITSRTIRDPWSAGADVFEASYDRIDRCLPDLMLALGAVPAATHK